METKICTKCGIEKPIEDFAFRDKTKGIRRAECKKCICDRQKIKYHKQKDLLNDIKKQKKCEKVIDQWMDMVSQIVFIY